MANQIKTKFIQDAAVTNVKLASGLDAIKIGDGSVSNTEFQYLDGVTSGIQGQLNLKASISYVDAQIALQIPLTQKGAANGVATLDSGGKIPVSQLPNSVMEFQGNWNATTNSPSLADGTGSAGDVYRVNVAGTQDLGSGPQTFVVGDWVVYNGSIWQKAHSGADSVLSVNGFSGVVVLTTSDIAEGSNLYYTAARFNTAFAGKSTTDLAEGTNLYYTAARFNTAFAAKNTDNLSEGSTNLYFTDARAQAAVVIDSIADADTTHAPSRNAVFDALALKLNISAFTDTAVTSKLITGYVSGAGVVAATDTILQAIQKLNGNIAAIPGALIAFKQSITLSGTDITNGYVDLAHNASVKTILAFVDRLAIHETEDYTTSVPGSVTRITFAGSLAAAQPEALAAGDKLFFTYYY